MKKVLYITMFLCYILTSCNKDEISMQRPLDLAQVTSQIQSSSSLLAKLDDASLKMGAFIAEIENNKLADANACSSLHKEFNLYKESTSTLRQDCENASKDVTIWATSHNKIAQDLSNVQEAMNRFNSMAFDIETLNSTTATRASYDLTDLFSSITDLLNSLQSQIDALRTEIESLQGDVNSLKEQVAELLNSVQSINVVPDYSDGTIGVAKSPYSAMRFEILPLEAAERITALGKNVFSVDAVNVTTRSANENGINNLAVESVSFDGNFVNLLVDCSNVEFNDLGGAIMSARLKINCGSTIKGSSYFNMVRISSNLFNKETAEAGMHIKAYPNGSVAPAYNALDKYGVSDYIKVKGQDIYTNARTGNNVGSINVYDINKNYLRTIFNNKQYIYQRGDYYIRIAFYPYQEGQVNYGHSLLSYEPYYGAPIQETNPSTDTDLGDLIHQTYGVAALSWVDDDFSYGNPNNRRVYNAVHDWCLANNIMVDVAFIPNSTYNRSHITVLTMKQWINDGFDVLLHPEHPGWYNDPNGNFVRDNDVIRNHIVNGIDLFNEWNIPYNGILVYPGNSHLFDETINITREYAECGICWDNHLLSNHLTDNERYRLRRMDVQLSATNTKTRIKQAIKAAIDNGDWVILGGHVYHFTVSDVLDETSSTTANLFDIVSYANSLCRMRSTKQIWNERKIMYDYDNR